MGEKGSSIADTVKDCLDSLALVRGDKLDSVVDAYRGSDDSLLEELLTRSGADALKELGPRLEAAVHSARSSAALGENIDDRTGKVVLAWAASVSDKHDLHLAPLLDAARGHGPIDDVASAARARVKSGPLFDSLVCLALTGDARWLVDQAADPDLARVDLLLWEASAAALSIPELGPWLWSEPVARQALIYSRARGSLRERSLAASAVAIAADGFPVDSLPMSAVAMTTRVIFELAGHPEAVVWIPAVRALGRLAGRVPTVRPQLLRWRTSKEHQQRRRALTALASLPGDSSEWIDGHIEKLLGSNDPWELASLGPAVPYLARERSVLWESLSERLLEREGAEVPWSMTAGLLALNRTERADARTESLLRQMRARCLEAEPKSVAEAQLWQIIRRDTDFLDGFDPDPSFPDVLLDRAVRDAIRVGGMAVFHRASSVAKGIMGNFDGALRRASSSKHLDDRGHAIAAVESCTRAAALALWEPILDSVERSSDRLDEELAVTREHMGGVFADLLAREELGFGLRRAALRAHGNLIDATSPVGRRGVEKRGRVAAFSLAALANSRWARDLSRDEMRRFRKPVTDLLWRVNDALQTRPSRGQKGSLGPLAAWWMLCVGGIEFLQLMRHESEQAEQRIQDAIRAIRDSCHAAVAGAALANWSADVLNALEDLGAGDTMLAYAVDRMIGALDAVESALEPGVERPFALEFLAESIALLGELGRDPVTALASESWDEEPPESDQALVELYNRAVKTGAPEPREVAERWAAPVGPMLRPLVATVVRRGVETRRAQALVEAQKDKVGPYTKLRKLGGGGQADVWLVKREGPRRYVMKIPRSPLTLRPAQRDELKRLLRREAKLLESLHEAKVAAFYDHGWDGDTPYLVLQYLIGTDLDSYAGVRPMSVAELQPIVRDVCLGLRALHERGIVHRDLKPSNVFLRLQLPREAKETFAPEHRDSKLTRISEAVLIDFGIAALLTDSSSLSGEAEGTLGYLSPEQAQMSEDISGKSDVYGLAATIFSAMTGYRFFQEHTARTAGIIAHALEVPFENEGVKAAAKDLPGPLVTLLRWATELNPADRPTVDELADGFADL